LPSAAFRFLGCASTLEQQLAYARQVAARIAVPEAAMLPRRPPRPGERIRLGYFSANFHIHPVAHLIAGLIEHHDRQRFEVIGYGFDEDDRSAMRRRLVGAFDRFVDIAEMPDRDAAQLIHDDAIDILVDLHGWTPDCRAKILAYRPAPIQVNYLGYPGTSGADFIDYIIVDRVVVPPDQRRYFSEQLVYLPDCYQCNDDRREIAERTPSRSECGLPETGFVFCCFNNNYKITPTFFDVWMRLLRAVPESVLWLYEANGLIRGNLRREAGARGVAQARLVFAERQPQAEHLARHRLADLFLDTLPYNAHTTASDALWAGLPVLTCAGDTFAGRVAGSLLKAVGLDELVTTSLVEYEAVALRLTRDAAELASLRERLARNRRTYPLFDTARYTRHLEAAYRKMYEIGAEGQPPTAFSVEGSREISD
jgi:protein O-GlcNAc transferase